MYVTPLLVYLQFWGGVNRRLYLTFHRMRFSWRFSTLVLVPLPLTVRYYDTNHFLFDTLIFFFSIWLHCAAESLFIHEDIDTALAAEDGAASVYAFGVGFDSKAVDLYSRRKGVIVQRHKVIYEFFGAFLLKTPCTSLVVLSIDGRHH